MWILNCQFKGEKAMYEVEANSMGCTRLPVLAGVIKF